MTRSPQPTPLFFYLFTSLLFPQRAMWMLVPAPGEVGSPEQEKPLGERGILLSAAILVYSNWRRMASDWHNWFPFQTPQSKTCISPFVSNTTCSLQPLPNLHARCSCLACAVTPWVALSGRRRRRRGEAEVPPCWGREQNYQAPRSPTPPRVLPCKPNIMPLLSLVISMQFSSCCH